MELHQTIMGKKLIEHTFPTIAENLGKIAEAIQEQTSLFKQNTIEVQVCYYEDESGKKVYDIEHMQNEFDQKLKELQS
jgi:hypothetical protein